MRSPIKPLNLQIVLPTRWDPRLLILCFFAIFVSYAINFPGFARTPVQFATSVGTCFLLDALLTYFDRGKIVLPMSGIVTAMGVFLLTDAEEPIFFFFCAFLAVCSKYFLRIRGQHIFNPNNFGLVVLLLCFPDYVSSSPHRWGGSMLWVIALLLLGLTISYRVNRIFVSVSYYGFFVVFAFFRSLLVGAPWLNLLTPVFGPGMQLFVFFMITDPKTSPSRRKNQIAFGAAVAAVDNLFRFLEIRQAPIFALFFTLIIIAAFLYRCPEEKNHPWIEREVCI